MKITRRQALWGAVAASAGTMGFLGIRKFYRVYATPDLTRLDLSKTDLVALVDAIVPSRTDNPGASMTQTVEFVLHAIRTCSEPKTQNNFIHGLEVCGDLAMRNFGKPLSDCTIEQRVQVLTVLENEFGSVQSWMNKVERRLLGDNFIVTLKRLTVWGYCTSELGATVGLNYDYIPAKFVGDTKLKPGQKSWATS